MLIQNGRIYTMADRGLIENGFVRIENGVIAEVGTMESCAACDADVVDAAGGFVLPGLIDAHCHLGMWEDALGFEGDDGNEVTNPVQPQLRAIDAVNPTDRCFEEARAGGVTAVVTGPGSANPIGGQMGALKTYGTRVDDMILRPSVAVKFAFGENPKTCYHKKGQTPMTRMATASLIREALTKAAEYGQKKKKAEAGKDDPPETNLGHEVLCALLERRLQAHMHCHRADDIYTAIRIAREFSLDYVLVHATEGWMIRDELRAEGARVITGPFLSDRSKPELRNLSPSGPGLLCRAGVPTAICTDHPVIPLQYLNICAGLACRDGMDEWAALAALTCTPADLTGLSDRIGRLKPGMDADIAVWPDHPLLLRARPTCVLIGGRRVL